MDPFVLLFIIAGYFSLLMLISNFASRHKGDTTFFDGDRKSPWFLVAFGMIGSGISAVSLVSIPGNVGNENLYYFQFILGTIIGYLFIAFVLLPVFYEQKLVSIYTYLGNRFGSTTYKTGATFFVVSQSFGAALRLLLSIKILQAAFFDAMHIPHYVTILLVLCLIWLYTNKSGVKTIVRTDALQSFFLVTVIVISIGSIYRALGYSFGEMFHAIGQQKTFRFFDWDPSSGTNFFKQFIAGFLITVALVGLDQSMMQKTLTIKNSRDARNNVLAFSFFIAFAQTLFLVFGVLIYMFAEHKGISFTQVSGKFTHPDEVYPFLTMNYFGAIGTVAFFIAVIASTFASIDSCIAALTTSISYDFFDFEQKDSAAKNRIKNRVLLGVNALLFVIVLAFWNSQGAIINFIFKVAGYTYGPLLGLYLAGLFTNIQLKEKWTPLAAISAAVLTWILNYFLDHNGFDLGFLNIFVNAALTLIFLWLIKRNK